ncbi:hypothetical protein [Devosia sp. Naph2]|uniref:hypothetical protein n=1 Tax=Devosia polycyclovorans TaxID=3345148 RepID=UPI0035D05AFC
MTKRRSPPLPPAGNEPNRSPDSRPPHQPSAGKGNAVPGKPQPGQPGYVGRGHPPEHSKIRPGERRNPYGRKGKPKPQDDFARNRQGFRKLFNQPYMTADGQARDPDLIWFTGLIKACHAGAPAALRCYAQYRLQFGDDSPAEKLTLDASDEEIFAQFLEKVTLDARYQAQHPAERGGNHAASNDVAADGDSDELGADASDDAPWEEGGDEVPYADEDGTEPAPEVDAGGARRGTPDDGERQHRSDDSGDDLGGSDD